MDCVVPRNAAMQRTGRLGKTRCQSDAAVTRVLWRRASDHRRPMLTKDPVAFPDGFPAKADESTRSPTGLAKAAAQLQRKRLRTYPELADAFR